MSCSLLVPAAGYGGRFAGLTKTPKALIKFRWFGSPLRPMLHHSAQIPQLDEEFFEDRVVVCQMQHMKEFEATGLVPMCLSDSKSQADSVFQGMSILPRKNDVLVVNCDNGIRFPYSVFVDVCRGMNVECGLLTVMVEGGAFGYIDQMPFFTRAVEAKEYDRSQSCKHIIAGAFYFKSPGVYIDNYDPTWHSVSQCFPYVTGLRFALPMPRSYLHAWAGTHELMSDPSVTDVRLDAQTPIPTDEGAA